MAKLVSSVVKGQVRFCSNMDVSGWTAHMAALRECIPSWLMCRSRHDLLRLLRQNIEGMSSPQVYIKVPGVWTGGHEENCRFRSVNWTFGPGASEWFAVEPQHCQALHDVVKREGSTDLLADEGSWFITPEFLETHGIPFLHGFQRQGDLMLTKGGTLHWVRALGFSTHFSWNFGLLEKQQMEISLERYRMNDTFTQRRNDDQKRAYAAVGEDHDARPRGGYADNGVKAFDNIVPMQSLLLDLVKELVDIHSRRGDGTGDGTGVPTDDPVARVLADQGFLSLLFDEIVRSCLHLYSEIYQTRLSSGLKPTNEDPQSMVVYCERSNCRREIFEVYVSCPSCGLLCLACARCRDYNAAGFVGKGKTAGKRRVMAMMCSPCVRPPRDTRRTSVSAGSGAQADSLPTTGPVGAEGCTIPQQGVWVPNDPHSAGAELLFKGPSLAHTYEVAAALGGVIRDLFGAECDQDAKERQLRTVRCALETIETTATAVDAAPTQMQGLGAADTTVMGVPSSSSSSFSSSSPSSLLSPSSSSPAVDSSVLSGRTEKEMPASVETAAASLEWQQSSERGLKRKLKAVFGPALQHVSDRSSAAQKTTSETDESFSSSASSASSTSSAAVAPGAAPSSVRPPPPKARAGVFNTNLPPPRPPYSFQRGDLDAPSQPYAGKIKPVGVSVGMALGDDAAAMLM